MAGLTRDEKYWQRRNEELEAEWFKRSQREIEKELAAYYAQALRHIEKDINDLYTRFSIDNSMNMVAVQRLLQGDEFRTWRMDMKEYLDSIEKTGDKKLLLELNTLAMRSRISRLDKLRAETYVEFSKLAEKFGRSMDKFLPSAYKDFYYRNLFEIGRTQGLDTTPVKVDSKEIEKVLRAPWSGKNYSERIWGNQERLGNIICNEITSAMHRGCSVEKVSQIVTQKMNVGMSDARRLVRTELNYVQNKAALDSIAESGMKYYRFIATLDKRTSTVCREHDGKIYPVEDGSPGTNMPPLHPHCRSTIVASLKKDSAPKGQRVARKDNGRTYRVPADMKYEDWKNIFVDKKKGLTEWRLNRLNTKLIDVTKEYSEKSIPGKGKIIYSNEAFLNNHKNEWQNALFLLNKFGGNIQMLTEINKNQVMTPDYIWHGNFWDLKILQSEKAVDSAIRHGLKQIESNPGGLLLQYVSENVDIDLLLKKINYRLCRSSKTSVDIIVYKENSFIYILRYKKEQP